MSIVNESLVGCELGLDLEAVERAAAAIAAASVELHTVHTSLESAVLEPAL